MPLFASAHPIDRASRRVIFGLAVTQVVGWGTTFNMATILARPIKAELALPGELIYGGTAFMLLASAAVAPRIGKAIDRHGTRLFMAAGSLIVAVALVVLSLAQGFVTFAFAWVLFGIALPMSFGMAAFASLAQFAGPAARRAIGTLTLFTGISSTIFWPLTDYLDGVVGWRGTCLAFALLNAAVCLPIHLAVLKRPAGASAARADGEQAVQAGLLPEAKRGVAFALIAIAFTGQGFVSWGLSPTFIDLLRAGGLANAAAVAVAALMGPAQVSARLIDWLAAGRISPFATGLIALICGPAAFVGLLVDQGPLGAAFFAIAYGACNGLMTIARAVIPLQLFGAAVYGAYLGRLTTPQHLVFAASPVIFAAALSRGGPQVCQWLGFAAMAISLAAMLILVRYCRGAVRA